PSSMAWSITGNLLVANRYGNTVLQYAPNGTFINLFAAVPEPTHILAGEICGPDCNANGSPDGWDIATGLSSDLNHNGIPDDCESCIGDLNGDRSINLNDLVVLLSNYGESGATYADGDI